MCFLTYVIYFFTVFISMFWRCLSLYIGACIMSLNYNILYTDWTNWWTRAFIEKHLMTSFSFIEPRMNWERSRIFLGCVDIIYELLCPCAWLEGNKTVQAEAFVKGGGCYKWSQWSYIYTGINDLSSTGRLVFLSLGVIECSLSFSLNHRRLFWACS